jgi:hypothetical protein
LHIFTNKKFKTNLFNLNYNLKTLSNSKITNFTLKLVKNLNKNIVVNNNLNNIYYKLKFNIILRFLHIQYDLNFNRDLIYLYLNNLIKLFKKSNNEIIFNNILLSYKLNNYIEVKALLFK